MRIGALFQLTTAANYRVVHPMEALQRRGHDVVYPDARGNVELRHLAACDVVVVYQHCDAQTRQTIATLKRNGVATVWDNDLHIAAMPKSRAIKRSSGGMSNERIFGEPETVTGSIGIFGVLPTFEAGLAKWGVTTDGVRTTPLSGQPDLFAGLTPEATAILQATVESGYERFLGLVAQSRRMTRDRADEIGQGRVWDRGTARRARTDHPRR